MVTGGAREDLLDDSKVPSVFLLEGMEPVQREG